MCVDFVESFLFYLTGVSRVRFVFLDLVVGTVT